jgi:endonuclease/exonuclease/phosphatase family metal-dependent hydrolase
MVQTKLIYLMLALLYSVSLWAEFKVASYNIRNFDYDYRRRTHTNKKSLLKLLQTVNADLYAVQEIIKSDNFIEFVSTNLPEYGVKLTKCGGAGRQKLGFIYRKSRLDLISFKEDERLSLTTCSRGVRPAAVGYFTLKQEGDRPDLPFVAVNLHLKAGNLQQNANIRTQQYQIVSQMRQEFIEQGSMNHLILGDLNTTDYNQRNHNYQTFVDFVSQNSLTNLAADLKCSYYWWGGQNGNGKYRGVLVDHILLSDSLLEQFTNHTTQLFAHCGQLACQDTPYRELGANFKEVSDHCPMMATLK